MNFQYSSYGIIPLISAFVVLYLAIYSYRKRSLRLHLYSSILGISVFFWCFGLAMEFFSTEMWVNIFWNKISYIGAAIAPPVWLMLVLEYGKYQKYLKPVYFGLLMVLPLIVIILAFTNQWHGLLWSSIIQISNQSETLLIYEHGPFFWVNIIYSSIMILTGTIFLIRLFITSAKIYRLQIFILILSGLIPMISSIVYISNIVNIPGLDFIPFGLTIAVILVTISIFKVRFLDIIPIVHAVLFKNMMDGVLVFDAEDRLIEVNSAANLMGIDHEDIGKNVTDVLSDFPDLKVFYKGSQSESELFLGNSFNRWVQVQITQIYDENVFRGRLLIVRDIDKRKKIENELIDSEERYRVLTEASPDAIAVVIGEEIVFANKSAAELLDAKNPDEIIGKDILSFSHSDSLKTSKNRFHEADVENIPLNCLEERIITLNDEVKDIEVSDVPIIYNNQPAVQVVVRDITERKKLEKQLKKSLEEKDLMMKEIHHRTKNNLMVIQNLLQLQSMYIKDKNALNIFRDSENRAKSMALIHQRLYQSNDLKKIEFGNYIRTLALDLFRSYAADPARIKLNVDVDNVMLDINTAIPLGLILNELISNSLKHAFPEGRNGQLTVKFNFEGSKYSLIISDDGIGLPDGFDHEKSDSLGLMLVYNLSDQIGAKIELDDDKGIMFKINFEEQY